MDIINLVNKCEEELVTEFKKIDDICSFNSKKVLSAFQNNKVSVNPKPPNLLFQKRMVHNS